MLERATDLWSWFWWPFSEWHPQARCRVHGNSAHTGRIFLLQGILILIFTPFSLRVQHDRIVSLILTGGFTVTSGLLVMFWYWRQVSFGVCTDPVWGCRCTEPDADSAPASARQLIRVYEEGYHSGMASYEGAGLDNVVPLSVRSTMRSQWRMGVAHGRRAGVLKAINRAPTDGR